MTLDQHQVLKQMQRAASKLWTPGRGWTPGEIAWSILTCSGDLDMIFIGEGWAWRQDDCVSILAVDQKSVRTAIEWAGESPIEVPDSDLGLGAEVRRVGYTEDANAPYSIELHAPLVDFPTPRVPDGYTVRSAQADDDLLGVHRSSWRPADLPFADSFRPLFSDDATSPLTATMLSAVEASELYRRDLHLVVEAPDSTLAASCIVWFDVPTGVSSIEPLGVRLEHRRLGLAGALSQYAVRAVRHLGGSELVVHPRGDAAYPVPRAAYRRVGFESSGRSRIFARRSDVP